jgi:hypothetical protein
MNGPVGLPCGMNDPVGLPCGMNGPVGRPCGMNGPVGRPCGITAFPTAGRFFLYAKFTERVYGILLKKRGDSVTIYTGEFREGDSLC